MLFTKKGNRYQPATPAVICEQAAAYLAEPLRRGIAMTSPRATREYVRARLGALEREEFLVLFLDNRHRLIEAESMFQGTIDGASVHPREVVKATLKHNAAAVILAHNHPSGVAEPSQADEMITGRVRDALALIDVRTLDHIVVTHDACVSFAERGLI